jgi:hypothetical protein
MATRRAHSEQDSRNASHFGRRFRVHEEASLQANARQEVGAAGAQPGDDEETLIPDPRGLLRPAEYVERKLALLLRNAAVPISFLRVPVSSES